MMSLSRLPFGDLQDTSSRRINIDRMDFMVNNKFQPIYRFFPKKAMVIQLTPCLADTILKAERVSQLTKHPSRANLPLEGCIQD
jgi:hypothetical protein